LTPQEFARKYFPNYKMKGAEIIPVYCPFCNGGKNRDKYTFALNIEKRTYNCLRGSCNRAGTFNQLLKEFGEVTDRSFEFKNPPPKRYTAPKVRTSALSEKAISYLKQRGFSEKTWEYWGIAESGGNLVFPYYENGKLVLVKYRKPEKYNGEGQKAWREKGGKAVFWGMDKCRHEEPLFIVEGEFDAMALTEAGVNNVVSVPSGAEDLSCVDNCWDWIKKFRFIVIWPDNDEPGLEMCRKLVKKLGAWRCWTVQTEYKDANEALSLGGKEAVVSAVGTAKEVPMAGLIRLADVKAFELANVERVRSSIRAINTIIGGYMMGQLSVWTGTNSSGKSTFLGQELITAIEQGYKVCAYSGEMPMAIFRYWIDLQAAGPGNLQADFDPVRGSEVMRVKPEIRPFIQEWYRNKFFIYDILGGVDDKSLMEIFEYAAMRYECKVFLVDNLMLMVFGNNDKDFYRRQSDFVKLLKNFAVKFDCHVHLVAHPRKTDGRLKKMDVMGSGDITNIADNVLSVHRNPEDEKEKEQCDAYIDIFKNRFSGRQDDVIALQFNDRCKRFYMASNMEALNREYGWTKALQRRTT